MMDKSGRLKRERYRHFIRNSLKNKTITKTRRWCLPEREGGRQVTGPGHEAERMLRHQEEEKEEEEEEEFT